MGSNNRVQYDSKPDYTDASDEADCAFQMHSDQSEFSIISLCYFIFPFQVIHMSSSVLLVNAYTLSFNVMVTLTVLINQMKWIAPTNVSKLWTSISAYEICL